eukprot:TRINITY_DN67914_c0_g1_i1.p1 TRINITY_DN67914_c0_g1~~TRINITY_DN67914_c0_g1_i1.p1  ORF type:complete len:253 (-),score=51.17 TRINITY_DN67914_c0_g1_i1:171-929(-)
MRSNVSPPSASGYRFGMAQHADINTGPVVMNHMPSHKAHGLVTDIHAIEERCVWLEERCEQLSKKLMHSQKRYLERNLLNGDKQKRQRAFEAWRDAMRELRLERQLDEQTRSLDECQQVAKELGAALKQEQSACANTEAMHGELERELQKALAQEQQLKNQLKAGQRQQENLDKRVHEAENCLIRSRAEAQAVVDTANSYEKQVRELEARDDGKQQWPENALEHSRQLREQAHGVMHNVRSLLQRDRAPELE